MGSRTSYQRRLPLEGIGTASFWPIANGGELAILFGFGFLLLATTGAWTLSVDARRRPSVGAPRQLVDRVADDPPRRPAVCSAASAGRAPRCSRRLLVAC